MLRYRLHRAGREHVGLRVHHRVMLLLRRRLVRHWGSSYTGQGRLSLLLSLNLLLLRLHGRQLLRGTHWGSLLSRAGLRLLIRRNERFPRERSCLLLSLSLPIILLLVREGTRGNRGPHHLGLTPLALSVHRMARGRSVHSCLRRLHLPGLTVRGLEPIRGASVGLGIHLSRRSLHIHPHLGLVIWHWRLAHLIWHTKNMFIRPTY